MSSITVNLPLPIIANGVKAKPSFKPTLGFPFSATPKKHGRVAVVVKAAGDSSDSSTSLSVVKSVQNVWEKPEDRLAVIGFGLAAVIALWASSNFVSAIDKLPLIPGFLEFVGILYSSWFVYRYLLFKPDREELVRNISKWISDILGQ